MELKNENFQEEIKTGLVLVDFFATWCGPCKMQSAVLEEIENEVKIVKVDVDQHESLAREYSVMSIPTLILFKDGAVVTKNVGFMPKQALLSLIEENKD